MDAKAVEEAIPTVSTLNEQDTMVVSKQVEQLKKQMLSAPDLETAQKLLVDFILQEPKQKRKGYVKLLLMSLQKDLILFGASGALATLLFRAANYIDKDKSFYKFIVMATGIGNITIAIKKFSKTYSIYTMTKALDAQGEIYNIQTENTQNKAQEVASKLVSEAEKFIHKLRS